MTYKIKNKTDSPIKIKGKTVLTETFLDSNEIDDVIREIEKMGIIRITKVRGRKKDTKV